MSHPTLINPEPWPGPWRPTITRTTPQTTPTDDDLAEARRRLASRDGDIDRQMAGVIGAMSSILATLAYHHRECPPSLGGCETCHQLRQGRALLTALDETVRAELSGLRAVA